MHSTAHRGCFPRKSRLPDAAAFDAVFRKGRRGTVDGLKWIAAANDVGAARLGLAVSKRCFKTAVRRNRVKRLIRESFRCNQRLLSGFDVIVIVTKKIDDAALSASLPRAWSQVAAAA